MQWLICNLKWGFLPNQKCIFLWNSMWVLNQLFLALPSVSDHLLHMPWFKTKSWLRLKVTDTPEGNKCTRWTSGSCHRSLYHIGGRAKSSSSISEIVSELLYFQHHTVHQHDFICKSISISIRNQTFPISTNAWLNHPWSRSMKISCQTVSISILTLQNSLLNFRSTSWYAQSFLERAPARSSSIPPPLGETSSHGSEEND